MPEHRGKQSQTKALLARTSGLAGGQIMESEPAINSSRKNPNTSSQYMGEGKLSREGPLQ